MTLRSAIQQGRALIDDGQFASAVEFFDGILNEQVKGSTDDYDELLQLKIQCLFASNRYKDALVAAEVRRGGIFSFPWKLSWDEVAKLVMREETWVLEYAVINDSSLYIWLISPGGDLDSCHHVPITSEKFGITMIGNLCMLLGSRGRGRSFQGTDSIQDQQVGTWIDTLETSIVCRARNSIDQNAILSLTRSIGVLRQHIMTWEHVFNIDDGFLARTCSIKERNVRRLILNEVNSILDEDTLLIKLHEMLLLPIWEKVKTTTKLLIVPDQVLFMVPWSALKDPTGHYLMQSHTLRITPSLAEAASAAQRALTPLPRRQLKAAVVSSAIGDQQAQVVAAAFSSQPETLSTWRDSTEISLSLAGAGLVHFSCPLCLQRRCFVLTLRTPTGQRESAHVLKAEDFESCKIKLSVGSIVVITACGARAPVADHSSGDSARHDNLAAAAGAGLMTVVRALMVAGAGAVVISLWDDEEDLCDKSCGNGQTTLLMEAMYLALRDGFHAPQALRFAMTMLHKHSRGTETPLSSWGRFIAVGASVALPAPAGDVSTWTTDQVLAVYRHLGLPESTACTDGAALSKALDVADKVERARALGIEQSSVLRLRLEVRRLADDCKATLSQPPAPMLRSGHDEWEPAALEVELEKYSHGWAARAAGIPPDEEMSRNWRPAAGQMDLGAKAGKAEKEALRALGFRCELQGQEIGAGPPCGPWHGLASNGMLTEEALQALGVPKPATYGDLWGANGEAVRRARATILDKPEVEHCAWVSESAAVRPLLEAAIGHLREALDYRKQDQHRHCKIRKALQLAIKAGLAMDKAVMPHHIVIESLSNADSIICRGVGGHQESSTQGGIDSEICVECSGAVDDPGCTSSGVRDGVRVVFRVLVPVSVKAETIRKKIMLPQFQVLVLDTFVERIKMSQKQERDARHPRDQEAADDPAGNTLSSGSDCVQWYEEITGERVGDAKIIFAAPAPAASAKSGDTDSGSVSCAAVGDLSEIQSEEAQSSVEGIYMLSGWVGNVQELFRLLGQRALRKHEGHERQSALLEATIAEISLISASV